MLKFGISLAIHAMFLWFSPLLLSGRAPALACSHGALYLFRGKKNLVLGLCALDADAEIPLILLGKLRTQGRT